MRRPTLVLMVAYAITFAPLEAAAQPWTPGAGEGTITLTYQTYYLTGHYSVEGGKTPNGATHSKAGAIEIDYGLTDRLALMATVPYIASKYTGPRPSYFVAGRETFPGPLDDGTYHGALQDLRLELRYAMRAGPVALAPLIGVTIPTHDYETIGEAVPGRNRRELQVGLNAGVLLDRVLPQTYLDLRYAFAAAEILRGYPAVRSTLELEVGRPLIKRVSVRGVAAWQLRHEAPAPDEFHDDWVIHDRFMVSSFTNLGVGVGTWITPSIELHATGMATMSGKYGAHIARLLTVGLSWSFGGHFEGFGTSNATASLNRR